MRNQQKPLRSLLLIAAALILNLGAFRPALADIYSDNGIDWFNVNFGACTGQPSGGALSGGNNAMVVFSYLKGKGLSGEQAAGVIGNMVLESGIGLERLQGTSVNVRTSADAAENSSLGWGLVQWTPAGKIIKPAKSQGKAATEIATFGFELDFLWNELNTNAKRALDTIKAATTPEDAAYRFNHQYEQPLHPEATDSERQINARAVFELATHNTPLPPNIQNNIANYGEIGSSSLSGAGGCGSSTAGYLNPFRDLKNSHPMRLDGGFDYGGQPNGEGPVYAVGNAKIVGVKTTGSGWPGFGTDKSGAYILYQLLDGPAKDKFIYIAEDCTPLVKTDDIVTHDTAVCNYKDQGTHLEIGWGNGRFGYVEWSDYPGAANNFASNSGQDISRFLQRLNVKPGIVEGALSTKQPPPDWPKW